jgi:hypothetical protein
MSGSRRRYTGLAAAPLAASLLLLLPDAPRAERLPVDRSWAADPSWDDGRAEVSVYAAERVIDGKPRPHELRMIVVKEDFADDLHVKADPPLAGRAVTTVLKLNLVATVPTDDYAYQFLTSVFVRRDEVTRLVKATVGSQEWCGNTFKEIVTWGGPPRVHFHSYFDAQADGERPLALGDDGLLDEQLLVALRSIALPEGKSVRLRVADPITTNRAGPEESRDATLASAGADAVETPLGRIPARRYVLRRVGGGESTYWVESAAPRSIVRVESSDGTRMLLRERARRDYWTRR